MNMDLALAIAQINPQAEYRLDHAHGDQIIEWRGPGPEPTADELEAAWAQYQADQAAAAQQTQDTTAAQQAAIAKLAAGQPLTADEQAAAVQFWAHVAASVGTPPQ